MIGTAEAGLWATVLESAMLEGFYGCRDGVGSNAQSISFLVETRGEWAESRRRICGALGIDEPSFSAVCRRVFEGGPVPYFAKPGIRHAPALENQRAIYREMQAVRVDPPKRVEPPKELEMPEITIDVAQPRSVSPIEITDDGFLYWPKKAAEVGTLFGWPLPLTGCKQHRVLRAATALRGGSLLGFRNAHRDWEKILPEILARYDLEPVILTPTKMTAPELTGEPHLFLRPHP